MKKFQKIAVLAILGMVAFSSNALAQCKVEEVIDKYKEDTRCNSVNMSKEMLKVIATQRKSDRILEDIKGISSIKILSVKMPRTKSYNNNFTFSGPNGVNTAFFDGETLTMTAKDPKESKEAVEKAMKEKKAQKEAEQKKKAEEYRIFADEILKAAGTCIDASKYTELMSVNEDGKQVKYYAKQEAEKVKEFVVVTNSSREYSLILIKGEDIQISTLNRLSSIVPSADIDIDL